MIYTCTCACKQLVHKHKLHQSHHCYINYRSQSVLGSSHTRQTLTPAVSVLYWAKKTLSSEHQPINKRTNCDKN